MKNVNVFTPQDVYDPSYCPWNGFSFVIPKTLNLFSCTFFFSSATAAEAAICCVVLWQWLFFHLSLLSSISILLFHCLFTFYRHPCSITLSPLAMSYSVFSLCCLLSHSSSWLAITAYLLLSPLPLTLYLAGYIRSSVRCLGLWKPVSYSQWLWHSCKCLCVQCRNTCLSVKKKKKSKWLCVCQCLSRMCVHAQSDSFLLMIW